MDSILKNMPNQPFKEGFHTNSLEKEPEKKINTPNDTLSSSYLRHHLSELMSVDVKNSLSYDTAKSKLSFMHKHHVSISPQNNLLYSKPKLPLHYVQTHLKSKPGKDSLYSGEPGTKLNSHPEVEYDSESEYLHGSKSESESDLYNALNHLKSLKSKHSLPNNNSKHQFDDALRHLNSIGFKNKVLNPQSINNNDLFLTHTHTNNGKNTLSESHSIKSTSHPLNHKLSSLALDNSISRVEMNHTRIHSLDHAVSREDSRDSISMLLPTSISIGSGDSMSGDSHHAMLRDSQHAMPIDSLHAMSGDSQHAKSRDSQHKMSIETLHAISIESQHAMSIESQHAKSRDSQHTMSIESLHALSGDSLHALSGDSQHAISGDSQHAMSRESQRPVSIESLSSMHTQSTNSNHMESQQSVSTESSHSTYMEPHHSILTESNHFTHMEPHHSTHMGPHNPIPTESNHFTHIEPHHSTHMEPQNPIPTEPHNPIPTESNHPTHIKPHRPIPTEPQNLLSGDPSVITIDHSLSHKLLSNDPQHNLLSKKMDYPMKKTSNNESTYTKILCPSSVKKNHIENYTQDKPLFVISKNLSKDSHTKYTPNSLPCTANLKNGEDNFNSIVSEGNKDQKNKTSNVNTDINSSVNTDQLIKNSWYNKNILFSLPKNKERNELKGENWENRNYYENDDLGIPVNTNENVPALYFKRLEDLKSHYQTIISKRNTIQLFHERLREVPKMCNVSNLPNVISSIQRNSNINCPTQSLLNVPYILYTSELLNEDMESKNKQINYQFKKNEFQSNRDVKTNNKYANTKNSIPDNFLNSYNDLNSSLFPKDLVLKGVQKLPKPNPLFLFHKRGCDLSMFHFMEQAKLLKDRFSEIDLHLSQYDHNKIVESFKCVKVDPILTELFEAQRNFSLGQHREKQKIVDEGLLFATEMNRIIHYILNDFYQELYKLEESPQNLRNARDKAKRAKEIFDKTYSFVSALSKYSSLKETTDKIGNIFTYDSYNSKETKNEIKFLDEDQNIKLSCVLEKEMIFKKMNYTKKPVQIKGFRNLHTSFPKMYPLPRYGVSNAHLYTPFLRNKKIKWEDDKLTFSDLLKKKKESFNFKIDPVEKEKYMRQHEERQFEKDWNEYLKDSRTTKEYVSVETATKEKWTNQKLLRPSSPNFDSGDSGKLLFSKSMMHENSFTSRQMDPTTSISNFERFTSIPVRHIIIKSPPLEYKRKARILRNPKYIARLPLGYCKQYYDLNEKSVYKTSEELYDELINASKKGLLSSPEMCQIVNDFCRSNQKENHDYKSLEKYGRLLSEILPFFPYQLDLQQIGIDTTLKLYKEIPKNIRVSKPYIDCFTNLLIIDEEVIKKKLLFSLCAIFEEDTEKESSVNTNLIDFLIDTLKDDKNADIIEFSLKICTLANTGHRKRDQYSLFIHCLQEWKTYPNIVIRSCLGIDAFAKRAFIESNPTLKSNSPNSREKLNMMLPMYSVSQLDTTTPNKDNAISWMPEDALETMTLFKIVEFYNAHRKIQGAACITLASLSRLTDFQRSIILKNGWHLIKNTADNHSRSKSVATGVSNLITILAYYTGDKVILCEETIKLLIQFIRVHRGSPEIIADCIDGLVSLKAVINRSIQLFDLEILNILVQAIKNNVINEELALAFSCFVSILATCNDTVNMKGILNALNIIQLEADILKNHQGMKYIVIYSCRTIVILMINNKSIKINIGDTLSPTLFLNLLDNYAKHYDVVLPVISLIRSIFQLNPKLISTIESKDLTLIQEVIQIHDTAIVKGKYNVLQEISHLTQHIRKNKLCLRNPNYLNAIEAIP